MIITPRVYQENAVDFYFECPERGRTPIACAPTGSGKTIIQALIAKEEVSRGRSVSILTPRFEIFEQTQNAMESVIGEHSVGLLRAGDHWNRSKPVHVVSWPTLTRRMQKSMTWMPDVDSVLVDECHLSMAPKIREVLYHYLPRAKIHAFTATPSRQTGKGLGAFYSDIKHVTSVRQLIAEGYLVPMEYWGGDLPDLQGVKISSRSKDYETTPLSERCVQLVGDVVDNWLRLASDRHTLVFAVDIAHAEALCDRFLECGVRAGVVHNRQSPNKRNETIAKFRSGQYQVMVNVMIASYGFDVPSINCIVAARPTKSLVLWLQMLGRGMRPMDGKAECMVLDHADNTRQLGQADDLFRWRLDGGKTAAKNWSRMEESGEKEESQTNECENCHYLFSRSRVCPMCGWEKPFAKRDVDIKEADLVRISGQIANTMPEGWPEHEMVWRMLKYHQIKKEYSFGWTLKKFEKLAGIKPPKRWNQMAGVPPAPRVANWIKKEAQNFARRKSYAKKSAKS